MDRQGTMRKAISLDGGPHNNYDNRCCCDSGVDVGADVDDK